VIAGAIAASVSTLACHPLDVVRTELQVITSPLTARECVAKICK
jgi:hypothetical protein